MYLCFAFQLLDYIYTERGKAPLHTEFDTYNITAKCMCKHIVCEYMIALTVIYGRKF